MIKQVGNQYVIDDELINSIIKVVQYEENLTVNKDIVCIVFDECWNCDCFDLEFIQDRILDELNIKVSLVVIDLIVGQLCD